MYIITTFPSLKIDIEEFSAIKRHLLSFGYDRLKQTGGKGSRKKTNNQWFETQDTIGYWDDFSKQKIIWKRIGSILRFSLVEESMMALDSTCFAIGENLKYLTAILNSDLGKFMMRHAPKTGTGDLIVSVQAIEPLLIIKPNCNDVEKVNILIDKIVNADSQNEILIIENQLNEIIFKFYQLSQEEILFIESGIQQ